MINSIFLSHHVTHFRNPEPWGKAYGYSGGLHAALLLLLLLSAWQSTREMKVVVTEIRFLEKPLVSPAQQKDLPKVDRLLKGDKIDGRKGTPTRRRGSLMERKGRSAASDKATSQKGKDGVGGSSKGKADHAIIPPRPIAGPIISLDRIGKIGKKKGALIESAGRTSSGANRDLATPDFGTRSGNDLIALNSVGVDSLKQQESSIGSPLVSRQVVGESLGGRKRGLAGGALGTKKRARSTDLKSNPLDKDKWGKQKGPFSIEGPLKYRKILKMELPPYPRWAEEKAIEAAVSIRLWVNPKGIVLDNMYLERTSGYSELDHLAMEALRRFKFVALPEDQEQEDEWGVATFRFELRR